ncbi:MULTISPECIES: hypothetical protein [Paenibacillus]|uniref:hypothetical protein n=1 Tax=Paenibacillus TaxID=44249 RepID=UPI00203B493F|nr:hypothetical protein [Paenibacillus camelliae]MCM3633796.1 hypothetical protein [Paenibacillus camelliae]
MQASQSLKVFLLAGVKTSPSAFHTLQQRLQHKLQEKGITPDIEMLFPYGEMERNLLLQLMEVRADLSTYAYNAGIGGRKVWKRIEPYTDSRKLLLIGHSGGGVAAYQIARKIYEDRLPIETKVIQVGSPKTRIIPPLKQNVSYIHSVDEDGKYKDPITKLGSWGGWTIRQDRLPMPQWDTKKYAPGMIVGVNTIGGHADYFRHTTPFTDELSSCNLDKTLQRIDGCLNDWLLSATLT